MRAYSSHNKTNKPTLRLGLANQTKRRSAFAIVLSKDATKYPVDAFNCLKIKTSYNNNAFGQTVGMNEKSIYALTPSAYTTQKLFSAFAPSADTTQKLFDAFAPPADMINQIFNKINI